MKHSRMKKAFLTAVILFTFCFFMLSCNNIPAETGNANTDNQNDNTDDEAAEMDRYRQWFYDCLKENTSLEDAEPGDYVLFGKWEQDGIYENGSEDIMWIVAEKTDTYTLLVSRFCIEYQKFHMHPGGATWPDCYVRTWLNEEFLTNAFSTEEQGRILETEIKSDYSKKTQDRVFLLSSDEAGLFFENDEGRIADAVPKISKNRFDPDGEGGKAASWWLRTRGGSGSQAAFVSAMGAIQLSGVNVYDGLNFLRPAIRISNN